LVEGERKIIERRWSVVVESLLVLVTMLTSVPIRIAVIVVAYFFCWTNYEIILKKL
jgi:hypothetical protein